MFSSFWLRWYRPLIFYQWLLPLCDTSGGVNYRYGISFTSFPCSSLTSSLFLAMLALYVFFFKFMFSFFNLDLFVSILTCVHAIHLCISVSTMMAVFPKLMPGLPLESSQRVSAVKIYLWYAACCTYEGCLPLIPEKIFEGHVTTPAAVQEQW